MKNSNDRWSKKYKFWRLNILRKFNFTCKRCGKYGKKLHIHHIKSWENYPELRFEESNVEILCLRCHLLEHPFMIQYYSVESNKDKNNVSNKQIFYKRKKRKYLSRRERKIQKYKGIRFTSERYKEWKLNKKAHPSTLPHNIKIKPNHTFFRKIADTILL